MKERGDDVGRKREEEIEKPEMGFEGGQSDGQGACIKAGPIPLSFPTGQSLVATQAQRGNALP